MIRGNKPSQRRSAFTLVEVMIAAALTTFIVAGVLATFLLINRTGISSGNYSQVEAETRRALEIFGRDARLASDIHWNNSQSVTLTLPTESDATKSVTYAYDGAAGSPTKGCFYRLPLSSDPGAPAPQPVVLVRNVAPDFAFLRFRLVPPGGGSNEATTDAQTKQLQLTLRSSARGTTSVAATQTALSASYILRNKRVSN